ncbi:MAG: DsrE family protein [Pseudomonadales bacterium]
MKSVLVILSRAPYAGAYFAETLEAAMVTQAFDLPTSILFRDAAVNILRTPDGSETAGRSPFKMVGALASYEIDKLYVCESSASAAGVLDTPAANQWSVTALSDSEIQQLIAGHDIVMNG